MATKVCLPLCREEISEIKGEIQQEASRFDFFEIWLDYLTDLDESQITALIEEYPDRLILLFRRKNLESVKLSEERRHELIDLFASKNVYFDFDIGTQAQDLEYYASKKRASKLITSYHNYEETPLDAALYELLVEMRDFNPDIMKFAAFCTDQHDALRLMQLLLKLKEEESASPIVLGMGKHGTLTRCFGGLYGNFMTFVTKEADKNTTASGQISLAELKTVEEIIERVASDGRK